jgi:hypothetical protein
MKSGRLTGALTGAYLLATMAYGQSTLDRAIEHEIPSLLETYRYLHAHPEISYHEALRSQNASASTGSRIARATGL